jgi:hypothetical protein
MLFGSGSICLLTILHFSANCVDQLIRRLIEGVDDHGDRYYLLSTLRLAMEMRNLQPVEAVRDMHPGWRRAGVDLSEEDYRALARFRRGRHGEFFAALTQIIAQLPQPGGMGNNQDDSPSSSSNLTNAGEDSSASILPNSTTDGATSTAADSTSDEGVSSLGTFSADSASGLPSDTCFTINSGSNPQS